MKGPTLALFTFMFLSLACRQNLYPGRIGRELGPEKQYFTITSGQDTSVRCKGGTVLRFCPTTFIGSDPEITLEVQEVCNRGEAFLLGIGTLAADGRLLETEGMLYLNATSKNGSSVSINPDCPVQVEIPVKGRRAGTKWFKGKVDKGMFWEEIPGGFVNQTDLTNLETGQQLFTSLCAPCHCPNLNYTSTGPALGNITKFRDKTWLRKFTRNAYATIASKDSLAVCLWDKWKPSIMSSFPKLNDTQIDAIYQFIAEESARQNVQLDSTDYACHYSRADTARVQHTSQATGTTNGSVTKPNPYFAKIYNFGWFNCDHFYNDSTALPAAVKVQVVDAAVYDEILAGILFEHLATNVMLNDYGNGQYETYRESAITLPFVPARLLVIAIKGKRWFKYDQPFVIGADNVFTAQMQPVSCKELDKLLKQPAFKMPLVDTRNDCVPLQTQ